VSLFVVVVVDFGEEFQTHGLSCAHAVVDPLQLTDIHLHFKRKLVCIATLGSFFFAWTLDWWQELEITLGGVGTIVQIFPRRLGDKQIVGGLLLVMDGDQAHFGRLFIILVLFFQFCVLLSKAIDLIYHL